MSRDFEAVIGKDIVIKGEIEGTQDLLVEGRVEGTVRLQAELVVGPAGVVDAEVDGPAMTVEGQFNGTAACSDLISLVNGCHGTGELKAPRIVIEEGAVFTGTLDMETGIQTGRGE
jgi:cytoskeletal protein CcmA (bactofilin family)